MYKIWTCILVAETQHFTIKSTRLKTFSSQSPRWIRVLYVLTFFLNSFILSNYLYNLLILSLDCFNLTWIQLILNYLNVISPDLVNNLCNQTLRSFRRVLFLTTRPRADPAKDIDYILVLINQCNIAPY